MEPYSVVAQEGGAVRGSSSGSFLVTFPCGQWCRGGRAVTFVTLGSDSKDTGRSGLGCDKQHSPGQQTRQGRTPRTPAPCLSTIPSVHPTFVASHNSLPGETSQGPPGGDKEPLEQ